MPAVRVSRSRRVAMVAVLAGLLVLAGCRWAGGGIVASTVPGQRASFSFNIVCPTKKAPASGVLTYIDIAAGVSIRATPGTCDPTMAPAASGGVVVTGTYVTLPPTPKGTGTFTLTLYPSTVVAPPFVSGRISTGEFELTLTGAVAYTNSGTVTGNVVAFP